MSREVPIELTEATNNSLPTSRFELPIITPDAAVLKRLEESCSTVLTDDTSRIDASRDWWPISIKWAIGGSVPALPTVVARPASTEEVAKVIAICSEFHIPVTTSAGRSGVCGGAVPLFGGIVLDMIDMTGISDIDDTSLTVRAAAGTFGPPLEEELRTNGFTLGHWPQSFDISTLGGWLACRSAGQYSTRYGKIEDMARGLEVVMADSTVIHTGFNAPKAATGPDLSQLFLGSEGTLGVITEARLSIRPLPELSDHRTWIFSNFSDGLEACRMILRRGATPAVMRLYDAQESTLHFETDAGCVLIVYDEADPGLLSWTLQVVDQECAAQHASLGDNGLVDKWFDKRNDVSVLAPLYKSGIVVDTIEVAASWKNLPGLYKSCMSALQSLPETLYASAHLSHSYNDGACMYMTFAGQPTDDQEAQEQNPSELYYNAAWRRTMESVMSTGGSISHHHGIGIQRASYLRTVLGQAWPVMESIKNSLDPEGILNPGKLGFSSYVCGTPWP